MRILILVGGIAMAMPALARDRSHGRPPPRSAPRTTVVDDEPVHEVVAEKGLDTGQRREVQIAAPSVGTVVTEGNMIEHGPGEEAPARAQSNDPVSGINIEELAERQMRRYQRAIDGCVDNARKHAPAATGSVDLVISVVAHKVGSVSIAADSLGNAQLDACLTKAARTWSFSLPDAQFTRTIAVSPQASLK
jgi:hypothetical protein